MAKFIGINMPIIYSSEYNVGNFLPGTGRRMWFEVINEGTVALNLLAPFPGIEIDNEVNCNVAVTLPVNNLTVAVGPAAVGGTAGVEIAFTVVNPGPFTFKVEIPNDDPSQPDFNFTVVGNGEGSIPTPHPLPPPPVAASPYLKCYESFGVGRGEGAAPAPGYDIYLGNHNLSGDTIQFRPRMENIGTGPGTGDPITVGNPPVQPQLIGTVNAGVVFTQAEGVIFVIEGALPPVFFEIDMQITPTVAGPFQVNFSIASDDDDQPAIPLNFIGEANGAPPPPDIEEYAVRCSNQITAIKTAINSVPGLCKSDVDLANPQPLGGIQQHLDIETGLLNVLERLAADLTLLRGQGSPDGNVVGYFGVRYLDLDTGKFWVCNSLPLGNNWQDLAASGAAPPATLQTSAPLIDPELLAAVRAGLQDPLPVGPREIIDDFVSGGGQRQLYSVETLLADNMISFNRLVPIEFDGNPNGTEGRFGQMGRDRLTGDWYICYSEPSGPDWSGPF